MADAGSGADSQDDELLFDASVSDDGSHQEHLRLAGIVKGLHADLRNKYKKTGGSELEKIWSEHLQNKSVLNEYADAMHHLATEHWTKNQETRIDWCREVINEYFCHGGLQKVLDKERRKAEHDREQLTPSSEAHAQPGPFHSHTHGQTENSTRGSYSQSNNSASKPQCDGASKPESAGNSLLSHTLPQEQTSSETKSCLSHTQEQNAVDTHSSNGFNYVQNTQDGSAQQDTCRNCSVDPSTDNDQHFIKLKSDSECLKETDDFQMDNTQTKETAEAFASDVVHQTHGAGAQRQTGDIVPSVESGGKIAADAEVSALKYSCSSVSLPVEGKIRLLDVGSCFNPFLEFAELQAVGIDISPATESVYCCDFLHLRTTDPLQVARDTMTTFINNLKNPVEWLPQECFHVVVFSLLLEYFPAPYQRWISCEKAHKLLMYNGILVIVTPDSHKQHRNAHMVKSWKTAIESIGFKRWRYIKQEHLHCMVFRKIDNEAGKQQQFVNGITADMIYIPQDFHEIQSEMGYGLADNSYGLSSEQFYQCDTFGELPFISSESEED